MSADLKYAPPGPVARAFMKSDSFVRGLRGPVGSGKSTACIVEIVRRAHLQAPNEAGIRRTRAVIVRNTNPELRSTTIKSWLDVLPEDRWGKFRWSSPYTHHIKRQLPDGTTLDLEAIFLALDRPEDVKKLLSLEATIIWCNEARELPKSIIDGCTMRVGRFPPMREGGPTFYGVILDTNAPDVDHWWPILAGEAPLPDYLAPEEALMLHKPENWEFFTQPPAMRELFEGKALKGYEPSPDAENFKNLTPDYYPRIIEGKTKAWIDIYVMNRLGRNDDGKPIHPQFREETHVARETLTPLKDVPVHIGLDFGLTPSAIFVQRTPRGQVIVLGEVVATDMGTRRFAELLKAEMRKRFPSWAADRFILTGDPAGDQRAQTDELTPFAILRAAGLAAVPAASNDFLVRVEAVDAVLTRMVDGLPGFLVDRSATVLVRGLAGGYQYKRLAVAGEARFDDKPLKNRFSHPCEALQYALLGMGEGRKVLTGGRQARVVQASRPQGDIFQRRSGIFQKRSTGLKRSF